MSLNAQQLDTVHKATALWTASMESDQQVDAPAFQALLRAFIEEDPSAPIKLMVGFLNLTTILLANIEGLTDIGMREFLREVVLSLEENQSE